MLITLGSQRVNHSERHYCRTGIKTNVSTTAMVNYHITVYEERFVGVTN